LSRGIFGVFRTKRYKYCSITAVKVQEKPADLSNSTYEAQNFVLLATLAQYISEDGILETTTLALIDIQGAHTGENLSKYVRDVIEDWGIASKLGFMQMDNASNNTTLIEELEARKSPIE
jgi:hypothetical protein